MRKTIGFVLFDFLFLYHIFCAILRIIHSMLRNQTVDKRNTFYDKLKFRLPEVCIPFILQKNKTKLPLLL